MKSEDINKLYGVTPELHSSVLKTLQQLDDKSIESYQRWAAGRRIMIALAAVVSLIAFSTAAYATNFFGLFAEKVGKYGVDMHIIEDTTTVSTKSTVIAKLNPTYLPKGCCQLIDDEGGKNPKGIITYNSNGNYKFTDGNGLWVHFHVYEEDKFHEEARFIVDSFEKEYNGNKTVFLTRRFEDNGEQEQYAIKYFKDWGYVVDCYYDTMPELMKIMEGLELQPAEDYIEPTTTDLDNDPYADYAFSNEEEKREYHLGDTFTWTSRIVDTPECSVQEGEYAITVKSAEEYNSIKGLDRSKVLVSEDEIAGYFKSDGSLNTPYMRTDINYGDGVNSLNKVESRTVDRHFYLVTVEVNAIKEKQEDFDVEFMSNSGYGGVIYQDNKPKNGSYYYTLGIIADEDELNDLKLVIPSEETIIDDVTKTAVHKEIETLIPLNVNS